MRVVTEQRVAGVGDGVDGAVEDSEDEGLEPGGATFGVRDEEDVVAAWLELGVHQLDTLGTLLCQPEAMQAEERHAETTLIVS